MRAWALLLTLPSASTLTLGVHIHFLGVSSSQCSLTDLVELKFLSKCFFQWGNGANLCIPKQHRVKVTILYEEPLNNMEI